MLSIESEIVFTQFGFNLNLRYLDAIHFIFILSVTLKFMDTVYAVSRLTMAPFKSNHMTPSLVLLPCLPNLR